MENLLKKKFILSLLIKSLIIIIGISGVIMTISIGSFMISYNAFLYYTIQSNLVVIIISVIFLIFHCIEYIKGKKIINTCWLLIKYSITVAITITFLVFFVLLTPTLPASYLLSYDNFSVHLIVPLLAILDFFLFDYKIDLSGLKPLLGLGMPLYYVIFVFVLAIIGLDFNGEKVPYFFLNYDKLGWVWEKQEMGVVFWIIILCCFMVLLSYLFALGIKYRKKKSKNENERI